MKATMFPVIPDYHYRFDRLPVAELSTFEPVTACITCGTPLDAIVIARLGGRTEADGLGVVACRQCGHVTYDRLPSAAWLDRYYRDVWDQPNRRSPIVSLDVKMSTWTPWAFPWTHLEPLEVPRSGRVLDFGCGFGYGMKYLSQLGYGDVYGVEMGTHRAEVAARNFPGRTMCGSVPEAEALAAAHGRFDLIVLHHVAEHLRDPFDVVRRLAPLLTPSGVIVIAVPNICHECPLFPTLYFPHLQHYNYTSMMRMMRRAGLSPFRWTGNEAQLVVAATPDPSWRPSRDYTDEIPLLTSERLGEIVDFIAAPWRPRDGRADQYVCYFHPWYGDGNHPSGFQHLDSAMAWWLTLGRYTVFPAFKRLPNRRGYGAFLRLGRRLFGGGLVGTEIVGFHRSAGNSGGTPWLTLANGDIPVLVK